MGAEGDVILKVSLEVGDIDTAADAIRDRLKGVLGDDVSDGLKDVNKSIQDLIDKIDELIRKIGDLADAFGDLEEINQNLVESNEDLMEWLNEVIDSNTELVSAFEDLTGAASDLVDEVTSLTESNTALEESNERLIESHTELEEWINELIDSNAELDETNSGLDETLGNLVVAIEDLTEVAYFLLARLGDVITSTDALRVSNDALRTSADDLATVGRDISTSLTDISERMGNVGEQTHETVNAFHLFDRVRGIGNRLCNALRTGFQGVGNVTNRVVDTIRRLTRGFNGMFDMVRGGFARTNETIADSVRRLMRFQVVFSLIRGLFNRIRSLSTEGLNNLAHYSNEFNKTMSTFTTDLQWMRNALAAAVAPLVNIIAPIFDRIATAIAEALNWVAKFFAAITGQKTYYKAVKQQKDYAKAVDQATQAMKEQVGAYDELLIIGQDAGGGGNSGLPDYGGMFETVAVDNEFGDILEMWENADFTKLGQLVGEKINEALESIPWDKIQKTVGKIGKSLATFINGAVETIDWELVGRTFAEGLNTLVIFWDEFVSNLHFDSIGTAVGEAINGFLNAINWERINHLADKLGTGMAQLINAFNVTTDFELVGQSLANAFNTIVTVVNSFVTELNFTNVGSAIARIINGITGNIDWNLLADTAEKLGTGLGDLLNALGAEINWTRLGGTISRGLNTIQSFWVNFIEEFDFAAFGTNISDAVNGFFEDWNADDFSTIVSGWVNGLVDTITSFFEGVNAEDIANKIGTAFNSVFRKIEFDKAGHMITVVATKFFDFFTDVFETIDWKGLGLSLGTFLSEDIEWGEILGGLLEAISGLISGVLETINGLVIGLFASDEVKKEYSELHDLTTNLEKDRDAAKKYIETVDSKFENIETNTQMLKQYADRFFELAQKEGKSAEELNEYESIRAILAENLPKFSGIVSDATTPFSEQKDAVYELIDSYDELAKRTAAQSALSEIYQKIYEQQTTLLGLRRDLDEAFANFQYEGGDFISGKYKYDEKDVEVLRDYVNGFISYEDVLNHFIYLGKPIRGSAAEILIMAQNVDECNKNIDVYNQEITDLNSILIETKKVGIEEFTAAVKNLNDSIPTEAIESMFDAYSKGTDSLDVYLEKVLGLSDAESGLNDKIIENAGNVEADASAQEAAAKSVDALNDSLETNATKYIDSRDAAREYIDILDDSGIDVLGDLSAKLQSISGEITDFTDTDLANLYIAFSEAGEEDIDGFIEGLYTFKDGLSSLGIDVSNVATIQLAPLYAKMKSLGQLADDGLIDGLNDEERKEKLRSAIGDLGDIPVSKLQSKLEIQSPSKVMKRQGEFIVEGLIGGIQDKITELENKVGELPGKIKGSMGVASDILKNEGNEMMYGFMSAIDSGMNQVLQMIASIPSRIVQTLGDLTYIGRNAATQMANGFRSVHIPVPVYNVGTKTASAAGQQIQLPNVSVSWLAQGAVLPPNQPFLAMLGDQKSGTNVEAPLDTIKQALIEAMESSGGMRGPVVIQLNGKTIAEAVWGEEDKTYKQYGSYAPSF